MLKRILVPTDFSNNAAKALDFAIDIASHHGSTIYALNTYKLAQRAGSFIAIEQKMREDARSAMNTLVQAVSKTLPATVSLEGKVRKSMPIAGITRFARRNAIDLIVMGTHGASGWEEVMGSTTSGVINQCRLPIMAIPEKAKHSSFEKIVLAVDGKKLKERAVFVPLLLLQQAYQSEVHIVHVKQKDSPESLANRMKKALPGIDFSYTLLDAEQDVNTAIHNFSDRIDADLICLIKRHRSFFARLFHSSVVQKEAYHSDRPLLILPDRQ